MSKRRAGTELTHDNWDQEEEEEEEVKIIFNYMQLFSLLVWDQVAEHLLRAGH